MASTRYDTWITISNDIHITRLITTMRGLRRTMDMSATSLHGMRNNTLSVGVSSIASIPCPVFLSPKDLSMHVRNYFVIRCSTLRGMRLSSTWVCGSICKLSFGIRSFTFTPEQLRESVNAEVGRSTGTPLMYSVNCSMAKCSVSCMRAEISGVT